MSSMFHVVVRFDSSSTLHSSQSLSSSTSSSWSSSSSSTWVGSERSTLCASANEEPDSFVDNAPLTLFPVADGTVHIFGGRQRRRTSTLTWNRPERGEEQETLDGNSDEWYTPSHLEEDSTRDDDEAKNDFWTITGEFIYRHHFVPKVKLHMPQEETFHIPTKYIDVTRTTFTSLDVMLGKQVEDHGNVDGEKELSDAWTGFTRFILLNERPPDGYKWARGMGSSRHTLNRRRRTEGPEPACLRTPSHFWEWHTKGRNGELTSCRGTVPSAWQYLQWVAKEGEPHCRKGKWSPRGTGNRQAPPILKCAQVTGKAGENGQHSGGMGGSSPWTRPSAPVCGDTLKALAGDQRLIKGGDRPRKRLGGRHRLGHRPVVLLRTEDNGILP